MRRIVLCIMICISYAGIVSADLLITAIMYDPPGADKDKEWVEIFNPTGYDIDLKDYYFESGNGIAEDKWRLEYEGRGIIHSESHFLIGEALVFPTPDIIRDLDLQNGPDAFRIRKGNNVVDVVGWGDLLFDEYFEGSPAVDVKDGMALARRKANGSYIDSDNNSNDFYETLYIPSNSATNSIEIIVDIDEVTVSFLKIDLDDEDNTVDGIQIAPYPGKDKEIRLEVQLGDDCSGSNLSIHLEGRDGKSLNSGGCNFTLFTYMDFEKPAGIYEIFISASKDGETINATTITFEYMSMLAFRIDSSAFSFQGISKGDALEIIGDLDMSTHDRPTIMNIGNSRMDIGHFGPPFRDESQRVLPLELSFSLSSQEKELIGTIGPEIGIADIGLLPGETAGLSLFLNVPSDSQKGRYSTKAVFLAVAS